MALSKELVSQFAKLVAGNKKSDRETTVYGTVVIDNGETCVKFDGSDLLTPVSTTVDVKNDERVTVMVKDHSAVITGNLDPAGVSARTDDMDAVSGAMISTNDLYAINATVENLRAHVGQFDSMSAVIAEIDKLSAKFADLKHINAEELEAAVAEIEKLRVTEGQFEDLTTEDLTAINATIDKLKADVGNFNYISADKLKATYANIDFSNIGKAAMEYLYASSGLIEDVVIDNGTIVGELVGVTIKGDLIEGGTVVADKLLLRGKDGLYYAINTGVGERVYSASVSDGEPIYYSPIEVLNYYKVSHDAETDTYSLTDEVVGELGGTEVEGAFTDSNEQVYFATTSDGESVYYASVEKTVYYKVSHDAETDTYSLTDEVIEELDGTEVEGAYISAEQTEYNSINGRAITANSITAEKIRVEDLVAFDATIGGFEIEKSALHTFGKDSAENTVRGIYLGKDGQVAFGDETNFIKFINNKNSSYYKVDYDADQDIYTATDEQLTNVSGTVVEGAYLETGEEIYSAVVDDAVVYYYIVTNDEYDLDISARSIHLALTGTSVEDEIEKTKADLEKHFEFSDDGLVIKLGDSTMKLRLDNDIIAFYKGEIDENDLTKNRFGWWDGVNFHTGNIVVEVQQKAQFGNFAFVPRSDGSLSFLKVADEDGSVATITFTDGVNTFTALPGMTFGEWVNSPYNTIGVVVTADNTLWWPDDESILGRNGYGYAAPTDVILDGVEYEWF